MNKYPVNITLTKLETRSDAEYPQEEKYPSITTIRHGLMWDWSMPKVGEQFNVKESKMWSKFTTSRIEKIDIVNENEMLLTTLNSVYKLEILN
jgi:hypothetical protein